MVTQPETRESSSFRKVSKPLMEKKRRARINVSLEQLKSLLEKNYSQNIRKRKLEKADILELTVKYLKTLQCTVQGAPILRSAEYQAGFRHCLSSVGQFLLKSEECGGRPSPLSLVQDLSLALPPGTTSCFSTKDSSALRSAGSPSSAGPDHKHSTHVGYPGSSNHPPTLKSSPHEAPHAPASSVRPPAVSGSHNTCRVQNVWRPW